MHIEHGGVQRVFVGRAFGRGMATYERLPGYSPSAVPTKAGARWFPPEPDHHPVTDQEVPLAMGNKWDGGKLAYQERLYAAAKKLSKTGRGQVGLTKKDVDELKPRVVA